MFRFSKDLYCDVRIEEVTETKIAYNLGEVEESKVRKYKGGFIRIFDGIRWYYSSTSNMDNLQAEIDELSKYATANENISDDKVVKKFEVNKGQYLKYQKNNVENISIEEKDKLLKEFFPIIKENEYISNWTATYIDRKIVKEIYSSKGTAVKFDMQNVGVGVYLNLSNGEKNFSEMYQASGDSFECIKNKNDELRRHIEKCEDMLLNAVDIEPGKYTVVLSPLASGIFAHESFGHKSEADFMVGDETMKKEWKIGTRVGNDILSIIDDGNVVGSGFIPFDDEGTKANKTYLIKNGILEGRLHSSNTAASLEEEVTGNARAKDFEFEPIVRMTTTYIGAGDKTKDELISEVKDGILIEGIKHGSGMSTFTLAPSIAYRIKDGQIAEPVNISVISGNVMETLYEIDGLSNEVELLSFVTGGCGKMEQYPLPVGFGGPYVRVKEINVQ